ncbi:MAG TPA: hypothetical protein ENN69_01515 [Spirochaetia bacterium]|nr:hypothetical protein [Spirochaetia bacterium]
MIRIVQLTDLHLTLPSFQEHRRYDPHFSGGSLLPRVADVVTRATEEKADLIAVTGDLLDIPAELLDAGTGSGVPNATLDLLAREAGEAYLEVRTILRKAGLPVLVLPGNHDHPAAFGSVFGSGGRELEIAGFRILAFWDAERPDHVPERIGSERRRFEEALTDPGPMPQIHFQHFPINPVDNRDYPHNYRDRELMTTKLAAAGKVVLAAGGHYHPGTPLVREGDCALTVCPTFCHPPRPWRLYTITKKRVGMEEYHAATP